MNCRQTRDALSVWDVTTDLPEPVVAHLDACEACRAHLDAMWAPIPLQPVPTLPRAEERLLGSLRQQRRSVVPAALASVAAAAMVLLSVGLSRPAAMAEPELDLLADVCSPTWPIDEVCDT
jgi:predicted anti-sigma-YlaC factor YlaD